MRQRLRIAVGDVSVTHEAPRSSNIINIFPARIKASFLLGASEIVLVLALGAGGSGTDILARITRYSFDALRLKDGMDVFAQLTSRWSRPLKRHSMPGGLHISRLFRAAKRRCLKSSG